MRRRTYLTTAGLVAIAGCSDMDSSDATTTGTPSPASFDVVDAGPESVNVGERFRYQIEVENTGGRDGTFEDTLEGRVAGGEWRELSTIELEVPAGETRTWEGQETESEEAGTVEFRFADDGYTWEFTAERVSSRPEIEDVNLVSEWDDFGDAIDNAIPSADVGERIAIAFRHRSVVHDGTLHIFAQAEIYDTDTGDRVDIDNYEDDQVTEGSGYQDWEHVLRFDTTGWDPGEYRAEVFVRDEETGDVSAPAETTFELQ
ncbi:MAG: hypothetical protein ACOCY1_00410 [Halovenus sp.]